MSFEQWLHDVDALCLAWYSVSIHDLPDMLFRDAYDSGLTAKAFMQNELGSLDQLRSVMLG